MEFVTRGMFTRSTGKLSDVSLTTSLAVMFATMPATMLWMMLTTIPKALVAARRSCRGEQKRYFFFCWEMNYVTI